MKLFGILVALFALSCAQYEHEVANDSELRAAFINTTEWFDPEVQWRIYVTASFVVDTQISFTNLDEKRIMLHGAQTITSNIQALPLFQFGGLDLELTIKELSLIDSYGQGLINFISGELRIESGTFTGITTNSKTLIKATNSDVTIGDGLNLLTIENIQFGPLSCAVLLAGCKSATINKVGFYNLRTQTQLGDEKYLTPALTIFASNETIISITDSEFDGNSFNGQSAGSGALFIEFGDIKPKDSSVSLDIVSSRFYNNTGSVVGAIALRNRGLSEIKLERLLFRGNKYVGVGTVTNPKKSSCLFTFEDLKVQLGDDPFATCYATQQVDLLKSNLDETFGNQLPFFASLESSYYSAHLIPPAIKVYVQTEVPPEVIEPEEGQDEQVKEEADGSIDRPFSNFPQALSALSEYGGDMILKGDTYDLIDSVEISLYRGLNIGPETGKPSIYNVIRWVNQQSYSFHVISSAQVSVSSFRFIQGNIDGSLNTRSSQLFLVDRGSLSLKDVDFTTNLLSGIRSSGFINVNTGYLYADSCTFADGYFATDDTAVRIASPRLVDIKNSNFTDNQFGANSSAALTVTAI
ncbi:MAG: hypothetical protein EZS28_028535, partial [Streblomastix strix]